MLKKVVQQGRNERRGGRYGPHFVWPFGHIMTLGERKIPSSTSEPLSDARTMLANFFSILLGLHQHLHQLLRLNRSPVTCTKDLMADNPLPVHHEGHRQTPSTVDQSHAIIGIMKDGEG